MSTVWYFAYGSNMQSETLRGRRGVEYHRAVTARLPGWRLVLDKPGLISVVGAFANIIPDPGAEVLGVSFELSETDLAHVDLTEGVLIGNYDRVAVTVQPLASPGAPPLAAFTLTSERRDASVQPTRRYMDLLIAGAEEHGLPAAYVAFLRSIPASEETPEAQELRVMMDQFMKKPGE
jgi:hypothetical protein